MSSPHAIWPPAAAAVKGGLVHARRFTGRGRSPALTLFAWGLSYVWTKIVLAEMGPSTLVCIRFTLATGLFVLAFALTGRRPRRLSLADHGRMFALALLQPVGHFAFETCGLRLTSATAAALIVAVIPLAVMGLAAASGRERLGAGNLARIFLSMVGVAAVLAGPGAARGNGDLAGAGCSCSAR